MHMMTRLRGEAGFTMVTMITVLVITMTTGFAALSLVDGDQRPSAKDRDRKIAYAAAEAGIQSHLFHLIQDNDYWSKCTSVASPNAVNQRWNGLGADTRTRTLAVPGSTARYAIELLPANGKTSCLTTSPQATMIDTPTGTFRIRSTGITATGVKRSVVATFRRDSFLNYIYYTDFETQDPTLYTINSRGLPTKENVTQRNLFTWASQECGATYWYGGRSEKRFTGNQRDSQGRYITGILNGSTWSPFSEDCGEIQFVGASTPTGTALDRILGPIHTNDELLVCGFPRMGRSLQDAIEVGGPSRPLTGGETNATVGWRANDNCSSTSKPKVNFSATGTVDPALGIWKANSPPLALPPSNDQLRDDTAAAYRFVGKTKIVLNGTTMTVSGKRESLPELVNQTIALPADGVINIASGACGMVYDPLKPYTNVPAGCGNVEVSGTYAVNLTINAVNDVIVMNDVKMTTGSDALLGLIAGNFVRIYHPSSAIPVYDSGDQGYNCTNSGGPGPDIQIEAAILALSHSFLNDQYFCGNPTGTLTIKGAISQKYRGPVGTGSQTSISAGYIKNYNYDDRLRFRAPPKFLDPVRAGWGVQLFTEQVPPT